MLQVSRSLYWTHLITSPVMLFFMRPFFPFATLYPNAGAKLRYEILLVPSHLHIPAIPGVQHMSTTVANIPTNPANQNSRDVLSL